MFSNPRRLVSTALAIVLGVAFVAAALALGRTLSATLEQQAAAPYRDATIVVAQKESDGAPPVSPAVADGLRSLPGVTSVAPRATYYGEQETSRGSLPIAGVSMPAAQFITQVSGQMPSKPGEVAVTESLVKERSVQVGQDLQLKTGSGKTITKRVVGVVELNNAIDPGPPAFVASSADVLALSGGAGYDDVVVTAPGSDPDALATQARSLPGASALAVRTGEEQVKHEVEALTQGTQIVTGLILAFAAISVLVSAIVIANTFSILIAQRTRELALLRAVGATRAQVFRSVLREALTLAVVASLAGLALGLGLVAAFSALTQRTSFALAGLHVDVWTIVVPLLVGIVVTVLATVIPARKATRVAPVAALRPDLSAPTATRAGRVRTALGVLLFVGGTAVLIVGAKSGSLAMGLLGGMASVVGVLLLGSIIVPAVAAAIGALPARAAGIPGQLAVDNARRNPARAASTASALFVGVALITLMSVGAATAQASVNHKLDQKFPVDVALSGGDKAVPAAAFDTLRAVPEVQSVTRTAPVDVALDGTDAIVSAAGVAPDAPAVVRNPLLISGLDDNSIVLGSTSGVVDGATVTVRSLKTDANGTSQTLKLRAFIRQGVGDGGFVTAATATRLNPQAPAQAWVRLRDGADVQHAQEAINQAMLPYPGIAVAGAAQERAELEKTLNMMLYIVTGLLAVAVLIALVGVGNTLALSVLERTRETGLLRALGVTRRQVRSMLGMEALTLAGVGVVLGIVLGIGYGIAGAYTLLGSTMDIVPALPWTRLALVAAVALGAGWLASVLPGRRAAQIPPSTALATD